MATGISSRSDAATVGGARLGRRAARAAESVSRLLVWLCVLGVHLDLPAADRLSRLHADRAQRRFGEARARFQSDTNDTTRAWELGRAAFEWADFAQDNRQRESIANEGIAACRSAVARDAKLAAAHYYLGMNLGQLARARKLEALGIVKEMERRFATARRLDETLDYAGPDRNLGLLYWRAPGWPASIGSRVLAREHLERAARLGSEYPDNRLNLMEALLQWKDAERLAREIEAYAVLLPGARQAFAGATWERSWHDWDQRWLRIRTEVERKKKRADQ